MFCLEVSRCQSCYWNEESHEDDEGVSCLLK